MARTSPIILIAATASVGAGAIHVAVAGPHLTESVPLGVGFFVTAWLQLLLAAMIWKAPNRLSTLSLLGVHLAAIGAFWMSQTIGLPFGHAHTGAAGVAAMVTVALEVVAVLSLGASLRRGALEWSLPAGASLGMIGILLAVASAGVAAGEPVHVHDVEGTVETSHAATPQEAPDPPPAPEAEPRPAEAPAPPPASPVPPELQAETGDEHAEDQPHSHGDHEH